MSTVSFSREEVAEQCRAFGPLLQTLPANVDGTKLLWAFSGNESTFGRDCTPRHEPAFDVGGALATGGNMPHLLSLYGPAAACSYGPWQIMFCNAPQGTTPADFLDIHLAAQATVGFLNSQLRRFRCTSLTQIGQTWNAGHPLMSMSAGVAAYCAELAQNYAVPMPNAQLAAQ